MDSPPYRPLVVLIALTACAFLALTYGMDVRAISDTGIRAELPGVVGTWQGTALYYCQNPACQKDFIADKLSRFDVCPDCGGKLDTASIVERQILPADTIITKARYTQSDGRTLYVAVVMSGSDRSSIHRPQLCLVAQGNEIFRSRTVKVPLVDGRHMKIEVLDLSRRQKSGRTFDSYYAYWFACRGRETHSHVIRMFWMAWDRVVHSESHRWSYISISGLRTGNSDGHLEEIKAFVRELRPALLSPQPPKL